MPSASAIPAPNPNNKGPSATQQIDQGEGFFATAYSPPFGKGSINGGGITKGGTDLRDGGEHYVIAAGPGSGLKMGDHVYIKPNPYGNEGIVFLVDDTGGAIFGKHLDIYVPTHAQAISWGRKSVKVYKTGKATGKPNGLDNPAFGIDTPNLNPLKPVEKFLGLLSVLFSRNFWLRVFLILGGGFLLGLGLVGILKQYTGVVPIPV